MTAYGLLADAVVAAHLGYLLFIPLGGFLAWRWRRLIGVHVAAVAIGLVSITIGFECPFTAWEKWLRERDGEPPYDGGFIDHYLTSNVYPEGSDVVVQLLIMGAVVVAYARLIQRRRQHRSIAT